MLRIPIEQAKSGMALARPIIDPAKPEHTLLKAGFKLDLDHIKRLRALKINSFWVRYPGLDFIDEMIDPNITQEQQQLYSQLKEDFTESQDQGLAKVDYSQYVKQMSNFFHYIMENGLSSDFVTELHGAKDDLIRHGTTVATLALLIGIRAEIQLLKGRPNVLPQVATDLTQLGVGCLLHDLGKLDLPEDLQNFHMTAHDMGSKEWQEHTEVAYDMIKKGLDPCAGQVIMNHHQHYDGSGFPVRKTLPGLSEPTVALSGSDIHIFCRIACLADRFDGFRYLPDGNIAPTVVALKRMTNTGYAKWFDPELYKIFINAMPAFNIGEQVTLNNGQQVVVTEVNEKEPCQPTVLPIDLDQAQDDQKTPKKQDSNDNNSQPKPINLALDNTLFIQKVGNFDVTNYLYDNN